MAVSNRHEALEVLRLIRPQFTAFAVAELALFGSFARNEMLADSDVDVLVAFSIPPDFRTYLRVRDALTVALGRPVDLVMTGAVKSRMRAQIAREAVRIA